VPVGDGAMPVVEIFKLLKQTNFRGCVNLEYEIDGDDPLLGMAKSFAYMRGVLAGLRG
jgi:sugar phosphate isomerase/epimerase